MEDKDKDKVEQLVVFCLSCARLPERAKRAFCKANTTKKNPIRCFGNDDEYSFTQTIFGWFSPNGLTDGYGLKTIYPSSLMAVRSHIMYIAVIIHHEVVQVSRMIPQKSYSLFCYILVLTIDLSSR